ncbi:hypothetical protein ABT247_11070 [Kitasatospora sp. NPDC001539]|uniref:hypothetical protein n=1 Tax=Kitasatospora sp. NPDC001539 TaxID=3154384 RepID=UPI00332812D8
MDDRTAERPGAAPEGRMTGRITEQDADRFRQLLAGLEHSLAADRESAGRRDA